VQFTGIDDFIAHCYLNWEPTWTPSRLPASQNHSGFGIVVLNYVQELKNIPFWMAISEMAISDLK
jgi:hypothetical protein